MLQEKLDTLRTLWEREHQAEREQFQTQRQQWTLRQRVEAGIAMDGVHVSDISSASGHRLKLWLQAKHSIDHEDLLLKTGAPVVLWFNSPDEADATIGIVSRVTSDKIAVIIDNEDAPVLEQDGFKLELDVSQYTFKSGIRAINNARTTKANTPFAHLLKLCFTSHPLTAPRHIKSISWHDAHLNTQQQRAVTNALGAEHLAWIHGPPGTGKTRTLVELAHQLVQDKQTILATAASNMAVDNLATRLAQAGIKVVRLGHPARVHDDAEALTLDAQLAQMDLYALAQQWLNEANDIRRKLKVRRERGNLPYDQRRQLRQQAKQLTRDARNHIRKLQQGIIERAQVVCATATGVDSALLKDHTFDCVIIDEATQMVDPIFLIPAAKAPKLIMAGDPHQLPPTIMDPIAAKQGLEETVFERLVDLYPDEGVMLEVQHRMHKEIMHFPSISKYDGRLQAAQSNAEHTLVDLGVVDDPLRPTPLTLIDTAGKGWQERLDEENPSLSNPEQANRTAAEVRRLISRGLAPQHIAVITPYAAQARLLRQLLSASCKDGLEVSTIDSFQGREQEAVIVDMVRSNDRAELGFLKDTRRMNVALSRAKRFLLVLADSATLGGHPYYEQFLEAVQEVGTWSSAWADDAPEL